MSNLAAKLLDARALWIFYGVAALSFATTLALPYIGEEGIYAITALEMKLRGEYFNNTLYGNNHGQPPLLNWLIIALSDRLGWEHVLVASRLVAASATIATGLVLAWLVTTLTLDRRFAAFVALVYLTSDALIYHGWLAYTDPLFSFFTFAGLACLWVAAARRSVALVWVATAAILCASLTKGQTAYVFYGVAAVVLMWQGDLRRFLLRPAVIVPHLVAAALFLIWHRNLTGGMQQGVEWVTVVRKLGAFEPRAYLHQLWWFPLEATLRFAPASMLLVYFWLRKQPAGASEYTAQMKAKKYPEAERKSARDLCHGSEPEWEEKASDSAGRAYYPSCHCATNCTTILCRAKARVDCADPAHDTG